MSGEDGLDPLLRLGWFPHIHGVIGLWLTS
jgi:hypothetical protein